MEKGHGAVEEIFSGVLNASELVGRKLGSDSGQSRGIGERGQIIERRSCGNL